LILNRKIDSVKKHGIGHINVNDSHGWFFLTLRSPQALKKLLQVGGSRQGYR
jgi:hypothetical protein